MKITVVGAGFSGLTLARELQRRNFEVEILEKNDRPGGLIGTVKTPSGIAESGAPSLNRTARVENLFRELGVRVAVPDKASKRRLFYVGGLTSWPLSAAQTASAAFAYLKHRVRGDLRPKAGESLAEWGRRCLGSAAEENLLAPAFQGIYAGDHRRMSASLVIGPMFRKGREKFNGVIGAEGGSFELIRALERDVLERGGRIHYGRKAGTVDGPTVLAVPPNAAADILRPKEPALAQRLDSIRMSGLVSVTLFYEQPTGPKAFGCLVPRTQGLHVLGILLNHAIFPGREGKPSETWILGGATDPNVLAWNDDELTRRISGERQRIFGKVDEPVHREIFRWRDALPHYDLVLEDVLKDLPEPANVWFHGNWLGGIGLSKILERSERLAERLSRELQ